MTLLPIVVRELRMAAREHLLTQFRVRAAARTEETLGILGQLGRWLGRRV
jgi:hypothetical protein